MSYRVGRVQDVEDLVADIFLKTVEKLDRFEWQGEGSFAAWLFRIAHNRVVDFYRRDHRSLELLSLDELPDLESGSQLPDEIALRGEDFAQLRRLIATLSPRRQEIITLKFFGGLRNNEIAQILELDERTVASHLCRGLENLYSRYRREAAQPLEESSYG